MTTSLLRRHDALRATSAQDATILTTTAVRWCEQRDYVAVSPTADDVQRACSCSRSPLSSVYRRIEPCCTRRRCSPRPEGLPPLACFLRGTPVVGSPALSTQSECNGGYSQVISSATGGGAAGAAASATRSLMLTCCAARVNGCDAANTAETDAETHACASRLEQSPTLHLCRDTACVPPMQGRQGDLSAHLKHMQRCCG